MWGGIAGCKRTGLDGLKAALRERPWEVLVANKLIMIQQCALAVKAANCILRHISKNVASKMRKVIIPNYLAPETTF